MKTWQKICLLSAVAVVAVVVAHQANAFDFLAQSEAENEIVRIIQRVLDVVVGFFGALLDELARFIKSILPFFGDDAETARTITE